MKQNIIMRYTFFLLLVILGITCQAQIQNLQIRNTILREYSNEDVKGSPFLFNDWRLGELVDSKGHKYKGLYIKYNICDNQMQVQTKNSTIVVDNASYPDVIIYNTTVPYDTTFTRLTTREFLGNKVTADNYKMVLYKGRHLSLFKEINCTFNQNNVEEFGTAKVTKEFVQSSSLWLKTGEEMVLIRNSRSLYDIYGKSRIKEIISENNLNVRTEEGISMLVEKLDNIQGLR